jgi:hypothetical protein
MFAVTVHMRAAHANINMSGWTGEKETSVFFSKYSTMGKKIFLRIYTFQAILRLFFSKI